jgi:hypothetical protein
VSDEPYQVDTQQHTTLRTRIATIVTQMDNHPCCGSPVHAVEPSGWSLEVADAVMAAVYPQLGDCYEDGYQHGRDDAPSSGRVRGWFTARLLRRTSEVNGGG